MIRHNHKFSGLIADTTQDVTPACRNTGERRRMKVTRVRS
ncbi:hypothetical protein EDWATA_00408 [Edwardsiella tarda ATCC 23685]|uniref:Uncharacterized protein n=1 Tax=Edwardsiella tarda ATCC 23685 TaxID=500638 RepID=D4F127_EDWTA|nr:hypothetical protein EDWATA_00408 [Edwardsiella tarda ATCC 23685]